MRVTMLSRNSASRLVAVTFLLMTAAHSASAGLFSRGHQEYRTLNTDVYSVIVQKNGELNVALSSGDVVFENAFPMVWVDGEDDPERLPTDGRLTAREAVQDPLGQGQGLLFNKDTCTWALRTYPGKPFLVVQVTYTNTRKKSVRIRALYPWCTDSRRKGSLSLGSGTQESVSLSYSAPAGLETTPPVLGTGALDSATSTVLYNPQSRRSLVAGFLTETIAFTRLTASRSGKAEHGMLDTFSAACFYDPPVELAPGASLQSELLYLAVNETDPLEGLERFGYATALANGIHPTAMHARHGWRIEGTLTTEAIIAQMTAFANALAPYGWTRVTIGPGWAAPHSPGSPDPTRFPDGFRPITDAAHRLGLSIALTDTPFLVPADASLVREHPDWFAASDSDTSHAVLNVRVPEAYAHVVTYASKLTREWGFDALVDPTPASALLGPSAVQGTLTRVQRLRTALRALRQGMAPDAEIISAAPQPAAAGLSDGLFVGVDGDPGLVPRSFCHWYYSPWVYTPQNEYLPTGPASPLFSQGEPAPELILQALTGGPLTLTGDPTEWAPDFTASLRRLLPTSPQSARPADLLVQNIPSLFTLSLPDARPEWHLAALTTGHQRDETFPLASLGAASGGFYTLYDPVRHAYLGHVASQLQVPIDAEQVRLLALRKDSDRPMVLGIDQGILGGLFFTTNEDWDTVSGTLSGSFPGIAGTTYRLDLYVPETWQCTSFQSGGINEAHTQTGRLLRATLPCAVDGAMSWRGAFTHTP